MTVYLRTKPLRCPGCGAVSVGHSDAYLRSRGSGSGIRAAEAICLDGRRIYGEGQEISEADVEWLGFTVEGKVGTITDRAPAPHTGPQGGSLCFVVPAHARADLSSVCFPQVADACETLRKGGLDARVVVIADDENLALAAEHEFATITMSNRGLGRALGAKFNAGYQYALDQGFDWVAALGSDSWIEPSRYLRYELPFLGEMFCTRNYTVVNPKGNKRYRLRVAIDGGIGTRLFRTEMIRTCGHLPIEPERPTGNDTATLNSLRSHQQVRLLYTDEHPFEVVGFQSSVQVTPFGSLRTFMIDETDDIFSGLEQHFSAKHIAAVQRFYEK